VTTCEVLSALGIEPALSSRRAQETLASGGVAFMPIGALAPEIAATLALRSKLGVRNTAHTLVKMLQPFAGTALRIVSVTHPDYLRRMREYFTHFDTAALLLRGAEGEAVAHLRREPAIEWLFEGTAQTWTTGDSTRSDEAAEPGAGAPRLQLESGLSSADSQQEQQPPSREAHATAHWIESALAGKVPVPRAIGHQVDCCVRALAAMRSAATERS
jgi:anthranilate phosphoribosyltransferase